MIIESAEKIAERSHYGENPSPISVKAAREGRLNLICQTMARKAAREWDEKQKR